MLNVQVTGANAPHGHTDNGIPRPLQFRLQLFYQFKLLVSFINDIKNNSYSKTPAPCDARVFFKEDSDWSF